MRTLPSDIRELGQTPLCEDLARRELVAVARFGVFLDRRPGQLLCRVGRSAGQICVIVRGVATASTCGSRRFLRRGDCFGSVEAEPSGDAPVVYRAATTVTLFVVGSRDLMNLRNVCPRLAARLVGEGETAAAPPAVPVPVRVTPDPVPVSAGSGFGATPAMT